MSENLTTTATTPVPRIIPPHPRYPGGGAGKGKAPGTKSAAEEQMESVVAAAGRAEVERAVVAKLSEELGSGVLFAENSDAEFDFAPPGSAGKSAEVMDPGSELVEKSEPAEKSSKWAGGRSVEDATGRETIAKKSVEERGTADPLEKENSTVIGEVDSVGGVRKSGGEAMDTAKGAKSDPAEGKLSWIKRQRQRQPKVRPVAVAGEVSPFNDLHPAAKKKSFWERLREKERGPAPGEEKGGEAELAKRTNQRDGPAIESWVEGIGEDGVDGSEAGAEGAGAAGIDGPTVRAEDAVKSPVSGTYRSRSSFGTRKNLVGAIGLACALAFGLWVFWQYDGEPPADANLIAEVEEIQHTNSVHMQLSHFLMRYSFDDSLSEMSGWRDYDSETLGAYLAKNGSALELILSCLAEKDWEPRHQVWRDGNLGGDLPWAELARVKQAEALYLQRRGLEVGAFRAAFDLMEFGRKIQEVKAWPNYFLTGLDIYHRGLETVEQLVDDTRMNSAQLGALQRTFASHFPPGEDDLVTFYKASYGLEKAILAGESAPARPGTFPFHISKPSGLLFKPNRTLTLFADAFSDLIADAPKPHYQRAGRDGSATESGSILDSNRTGQEYFAKAMQPYYEIPEQQTLSVAHYEAVKTLFALRRHGLDMGRLPDTLADLGTTYLKDMPSDPFDGDTLRYSRVKKVVYSAGVDRIDSGGNRGHAGFLNKDEPTLEIPFSTGGDSEFH